MGFSIKIKTSLMFSFSIIILFVIALMLFFQYKSSNEFALLTTQKEFHNITNNVVNKIQRYDVNSQNFINLVKNIDNIDELPTKVTKHKILPLMVEYIKNANYVYAVYIGFQNDSFYEIINLNVSKNIKQSLKTPSNARWLIIKHINQENTMTRYEEFLDENLQQILTLEKDTQYKPTQRPWYKQAIETSKVIKTKPYVFATLQEAGVTYAKVINEKAGSILAIDISLDSLNTLLKSFDLVQGSSAFIFKNDGKLIGQVDNISNQKLNNLNTTYPNIFIKNNKVLDLDKQILITIKGKQYLKYTTLLKSHLDVKDYITIVSPIDTIMQPYKEQIYQTLMITIFILSFIVIPIVIFAVRLIVKPILELEEENVKIGNGEFHKVKPINSFMIEISSLSKSLVVMSKSIQKSQEDLEFQIKEKTKELTTLLNNAGQGFLTFDKDFSIDAEYSKECEKFLGKDIASKDISSILFTNTDKANYFKSDMLNVFSTNNEIIQKSIISLLPNDIILNKRALKIEYKILDDQKFMMILTNISAKKRLEKRVQKEQDILKMIVTVMKDSDIFYDVKQDFEYFINNFTNYINKNNSSTDNLNELFRTIHTYKGSFLQLYMNETAKNLHNIESQLSELLSNKKDVTNDTLENLLQTANFKSFIVDDLSNIRNILGDKFVNSYDVVSIDRDVIENIQVRCTKIFEEFNIQDTSSVELLEQIDALTHKSLFAQLEAYPRLAMQLAQKLEKEIYEFEVVGDKNVVVSSKYKPFVKSLIHLFRNSLDHGIETPEERIEKDKDEVGTISCCFSCDNDNLQLIVSDDGAGINVDKIRQKIDIDTTNLSDEEISQYIFQDNLSTKDKVTSVSGRGVGMSAIKVEVEKLDGTITIQSKIDIGTKFIFDIPL